MDFSQPPREVLATLCSPEFLTLEAGSRSSVTVDELPDKSIRVAVKQPASDLLPAGVQALASGAVSVEQVQVWQPIDAHGAAHAAVTIDVEGMPASATGNAVLAPNRAGSRLNVELDIVVRIALFSGVAEGVVRDVISQGLQDLAAAASGWMTTHP